MNPPTASTFSAKENIICFSSIDWDFIWQGHQQIMSSLAQQGHRVLFIENTGIRRPGLKDISRIKKRISNWYHGTHGIRQLNYNLYVYSPLLLPFPYSKLALCVNSILFWRHLKQWLRTMDFYNPIIWSFLPTALSQKMIKKIDPKLTIYYCIDKFSESSSAAKRILSDEKTFIQESDLVFTTSSNLSDYCKQFTPEVHFFPFGVDIENFENRAFDEKPSDLKPFSGPLVGYIGGIHQWIDFDLVRSIAERNPDIHFIFIGPLQVDIDSLSDIKNLHFLMKKQKHELPHYIYFFDVCIIPYKMTSYTEHVYPTKLNEYLSMGKPVISTPLKEIRFFNERYQNPIVLESAAEGFSNQIRRCLSSMHSKNNPKFVQIARDNSWQQRIQEMMSLIHHKIEQRELDRDKNWAHQLKKLYFHHARKIALFLLTVFTSYFLIFQTSCTWRLAQFLKTTSPLQKSDVILVLGGGVGESGIAGQGFQERVTTAVELYRQGYANRVIFSSGFNYLIKDAEIMKNLAISLGISPESIFLEENAKNTYENIKLSYDIIQKHHFKKIIIVSSPYHLKRVDGVARKTFSNQISYITYPVQSSLFFISLEHGASIAQLKALVHECLAILYYKFKNYS